MASGESKSSNYSEKISFFNKLGMLMKATSADDEQISGYLYDEVNGLTLESGSHCSDLFDYLCARIEEKNYFVKRKTLFLMKYLVQNGHPDFRENLRKNSHIIREATNYYSAPDPLLGKKPHEDIRETSKQLLEILFDEESRESDHLAMVSTDSVDKPTIGGMGSSSVGPGRMEGFGNTIPKQNNKGLGGMIIDGLRDLAEKLNEESSPGRNSNTVEYGSGSYQSPVVLESQRQKLMAMQTMVEHPKEKGREHRPGVAGGGWDDSEPSEKKTSGSNDPVSVNGSDGSSELAERLASVSVYDWSQEQQIVNDFILKQNAAIPKRADIDAYIERCSCVNCDKLTELLNEHLDSEDNTVIVRCLVFLDYMLRCDVVSADSLAWTCHKNLMTIFKQGHQQPQLKARKMIRQLERLTTNSYLFMDNLPTNDIQATPSVGVP